LDRFIFVEKVNLEQKKEDVRKVEQSFMEHWNLHQQFLHGALAALPAVI
jgi:hypothetical protein